ncbi:MAG TPA: AIM24 family protein [Verrucomicrobiae bacterium]|nr:AIM24 family protein [Verrucomicrobiae bacterium]
MDGKVIGTTMPVLEVSLDPGDQCLAETGELAWMTQTIRMRTSSSLGPSQGWMAKVARMAGGGGLLMTEYTAEGGPGTVAFAAKLPGQIVPVEIGPTATFMVHQHGFLCGGPQVSVSMGFQGSLGSGLFGGNGFVLQKVGGTGTAWIELAGEIVNRELAPGERLLVHPGHVGMFSDTVGFEVTTVPGLSNIFFGRAGLFLAVLTGPGQVWLQSMPLPILAHALQPYLATQGAQTRL